MRGSAALRLCAALLAIALVACGAPESPPTRPNLLFVVWDTVRADRTSLPGGQRDTTPELARFARGARVFTNAIAAASTTTPSHASMFTGLLPTQHGTHADAPRLADEHTTLAERARGAGYRTWLWSSNPHVGRAENLAQGFEEVEHPWRAPWRARAEPLVRAKAEPDTRAPRRRPDAWALKAAGDLAPEALARWLDGRERRAPFFAFVNLMEGHRPFIPPRALRERHLPKGWVERSYTADRDWRARWRHTFRLQEADPQDLAIVDATYDVALRELDAIFARLLAVLRERGELDRTVVVVTSDHGEHLGEHHRVDHQYSLYEELLRVPLVIRAPGRAEAGEDDTPVSGIDLFPTLLAALGLDVPELGSGARDLLAPAEPERVRIAEYPAVFTRPFDWMIAERPGFDPSPWNRTLRAIYRGRHKLIRASDGAVELYDLVSDPGEQHDLATREAALRRELVARLDERIDALGSGPGAAVARRASEAEAADTLADRLTEEERRMLVGLGYAVEGDADEASGGRGRRAVGARARPPGDA